MITLFMFAGEVFDYLVAHGRMKEKEARTKFRQVSNALPCSCSLYHAVDCTKRREIFLRWSCDLSVKFWIDPAVLVCCLLYESQVEITLLSYY